MFKRIIDDIKNFKVIDKKKQIIYISCVVLVIIALSSIFVFGSNSNSNSTTASNKKVTLDGGLDGLIGKTQEEATEILEKEGLKVSIIEEKEFSDTIPEGCVIEYGGKNPRGEPHYKYETMTDLEISAVKEGLKGTGVSPNTILMQQVYDTVEVSDNDLQEGDTVKLTISKGKPINVPYLIGKTQEAAQKMLEELGLKCKIETESDYNSPQNIVIQQSKNDNAIVEKGTEIEIYTRAPNTAFVMIDFQSMIEETDKWMNLLVKLDGKEVINETVRYENEIRENIDCPDKFTITVYIDGVLKATKEVDLTKLTSSVPVLITNNSNFNSPAIKDVSSNSDNNTVENSNNSNKTNNIDIEINQGTYNKILNDEDKEMFIEYGNIYLVVENNAITIFDLTLDFWIEGNYRIEDNKIIGNYSRAKYYSYEKLELVEEQINDKFEFVILEDGKLQDTVGYGLFLDKCLQQNAVYEFVNE